MRLSTFVCCALVLRKQLTAVLASCPARAWVKATTVPILILEAFEGHTQNYYLCMNKCECKQLLFLSLPSNVNKHVQFICMYGSNPSFWLLGKEAWRIMRGCWFEVCGEKWYPLDEKEHCLIEEEHVDEKWRKQVRRGRE